MADVGEEGGLRPVQLGELLGSLLLRPVAAGTRYPRGDVPRDEFDETAVGVVERPVLIEPGDEESVRRAALLQQRHHERLGGRRGPASCGQFGEQLRVQGDERRFTQGGRGHGHTPSAPSRGQFRRCGRVPGPDTGRICQPGAAVVLEEIGQGEGEVCQVAAELPTGEGEHLFFGAHHTGV
ncbi:hypothetical protein SMICM304S_10996 [Streptomyces microflavus]